MDLSDRYTEFEKLYIHSKKPYTPSTSWTTSKEFVNSYHQKKFEEFIPTELKQIGATREIRTPDA